jgi:HlyD family secretion protein
MNAKTLFLLATLAVLFGCRREPESTLFVSGRIDGDTVDISSKIPGRIVDLKVREGDSVEAGQIVAWLSSPQEEAQRDAQKARITQLQRSLTTYDEKVRQAQIYEDQAVMDAPAQVKEAEATLASAQADLVRWEAELRQAQADAERYPPLAKSGAVAVQVADQYETKEKIARASTEASRKQVNAAEASLDKAKAQLENPKIKAADRETLIRQAEETRAEIAAAQAELRRIEANLADLTIHAPITGTILTRSAEPGRVIAAGQTILTMVDLSRLYLRGFINEGDIGRVKVGQAAQVFLDSNPTEAIQAEVIRIDPQVMFTPENTYFKDDRVKQVMGVKLGLKGAVGLAKPGMPADGQILAPEARAVKGSS